MSSQCPLIFRQVDATVSRINTLFVVLGVMGFLLSGAWPILAVLIADFSLRLYGGKRFSPLQNVSLLLQERFDLPSRMEDAGAKRLAAFFGIGFMIAILALYGIGWTHAVYIVASIYLACAALDLIFDICLACRLYHLVRKIIPESRT